MNHLFQSVTLTLVCLLAGIQLSAQCSNINNRNPVRADNHIFSGQSFGQSIVASSNCYSDNQFTRFSFKGQGNSATQFELRIYQGQNVNGTARYTQKDISLPAGNRGSKLSIDLAGGTGDLSFTAGTTYTFLLTVKSGNLIAQVSDSITPGEVYLKSGFDGSKDLLFELGTGQCSNIYNKSIVRADNHIFSGQSFGQSIVADADCYGGSKFSHFSFWASGNASTNFTLKIYKGQTVSGTARYTQTGISLPAANLGSRLSIELKGGTGNLSFVAGETYTFVLTGTGGNLIAQVTNNATPGQAYIKTGFDSGKDLRFEVQTK